MQAHEGTQSLSVWPEKRIMVKAPRTSQKERTQCNMKGVNVMRSIYSAVLIAVIFSIAALSSPAMAGSSAIGDLEAITGQTIDRSYTPTPTRVPGYEQTSGSQTVKHIVKKPSASTIATMNALSTTMMVMDILNAMDAADAAQAQAEAARAMAEAEQKRIAEEQRRQRLISAEHLRNFWDKRDLEISESLDDVFSLPGQGQGTNFFGVPGNPAVRPSDLSVGQGDDTPVAVSVETATPEILGTGAQDVRAPSMEQLAEPLTTEPPSLQDGIVKSGAEFAQESAKDKVKDIMKDMLKSVLPSSARNAELMVEHVDKMNEFTGNLFQAIEPQRLVGTLANGGPGDYQAIMKDLDRVTRQGAELGMGDNPFSNTALETGFKLLSGKKITSCDTKEILAGQWKGFLSEKLKDRLTDGRM